MLSQFLSFAFKYRIYFVFFFFFFFFFLARGFMIIYIILFLCDIILSYASKTNLSKENKTGLGLSKTV